jgi:hypothetical protein
VEFMFPRRAVFPDPRPPPPFTLCPFLHPAGSIKDVVTRYATQTGHYVSRR